MEDNEFEGFESIGKYLEHILKTTDEQEHDFYIEHMLYLGKTLPKIICSDIEAIDKGNKILLSESFAQAIYIFKGKEFDDIVKERTDEHLQLLFSTQRDAFVDAFKEMKELRPSEENNKSIIATWDLFEKGTCGPDERNNVLWLIFYTVKALGKRVKSTM
jgi:hypothetical protein